MQFGKCKPNGKMAFVRQALKTLLMGRGDGTRIYRIDTDVHGFFLVLPTAKSFI